MAINDGLTISVRELFELFPNEDAARAYIEQRVWPNGPHCPFCQNTEKNKARGAGRKRGFYRCGECKKDFSVLKGTVFEASHIPLDKWIHGMYLLLTARKGISSLQLSKELSISQTAAWFMLHRIREAAGNDMESLHGVVEIDECYIGGLEENKHANKRIGIGHGGVHKAVVLGMRQRGGNIKGVVIEKTDMQSMTLEIIDHVSEGSTIYTDEHKGYLGLRNFYKHETVSHKDGEYYVRGVGTNNIESVWAVLKRGLHGTYHHCNKKHLARYVNEFAFRLGDGNVKTHVLHRLNALVNQCVGKRITYEALTA